MSRQPLRVRKSQRVYVHIERIFTSEAERQCSFQKDSVSNPYQKEPSLTQKSHLADQGTTSLKPSVLSSRGLAKNSCQVSDQEVKISPPSPSMATLSKATENLFTPPTQHGRAVGLVQPLSLLPPTFRNQQSQPDPKQHHKCKCHAGSGAYTRPPLLLGMGFCFFLQSRVHLNTE